MDCTSSLKGSDVEMSTLSKSPSNAPFSSALAGIDPRPTLNPPACVWLHSRFADLAALRRQPAHQDRGALRLLGDRGHVDLLRGRMRTGARRAESHQSIDVGRDVADVARTALGWIELAHLGKAD